MIENESQTDTSKLNLTVKFIILQNEPFVYLFFILKLKQGTLLRALF